jgi:hypothetical protein
VSEPIATWNRARGAWETPETNLFCGHAALYSPTWPTSGSMRNGRLYPPLRSGHLTAVSASSSSPGLLPTPRPQVGGGGAAPDPLSRLRSPENPGGFSPNLMTAVSLLRTPTAQLAENGGSQHPAKRKAGGHGPTLADEVEHLLPTPNATDGNGGPRTVPERRTSRGKDHGPRLRDVAPVLLPTPTTTQRGPDANLETRVGAGPNLHSAVTLLPTPSVALATGGQASRSGERIDEMLLTGIARAATSGTLLPTPAAHDSANTPENHLRKKPGRSQVTSLQIVVDYGLLSSGGRIPSPSADGNEPSDGQLLLPLNLDGPESA